MSSSKWVGLALWIVVSGCGSGPEAPIPQLDGGAPGQALPATCLDQDGDGVAGTGDCSGVGKVDCADQDPARYPGAAEVCNGVDDDCSGQADDGLAVHPYYRDADGDGFGSAEQVGEGCGPAPQGASLKGGDCDDARKLVHPDALEACNGRDDDCDGQVDDEVVYQDYWPDVDLDGFGDAAAGKKNSCDPVPGHVTNGEDCDDRSGAVKPGATETCNGADDDCSGQADDGLSFASYYPDADGDGYGAASGAPLTACAPVSGRVTNPLDCNDASAAVRPGATETCNGVDDDCNGTADDGLEKLVYFPDLDADGYGAQGSLGQASCAPVPGKVTNAQDCNDGNVAVKPGAEEVCNGVDDDCDGATDEGLPAASYYPDLDGDGFGAKGATAQVSCRQVAGKVTDAQDCNDASFAVKPGAAEACNNADDDCDGTVDEGNPGGGGSCNTGQAGVCSAGTVQCQSGVLTCERKVAPSSADACDGLDNDCDNQVDEDHPTKNTACTVGLGVCAHTGTFVCKADGSGTACNVQPKSPTPAACDGLDNDCDGTVDEPALTSTADLHATAFTDVEVQPYYYSAGGCEGGAMGAGTDALAGGAAVMAKGHSGLYFQRLTAAGAPSGTPTSLASYLYSDVDLAQSKDGFLVAGLWSQSEIDLYYVSAATGVVRASVSAAFEAASGNALDSLRVVRGSLGWVTLVWRESGSDPTQTGLKLAQVEPKKSSTGQWTVEIKVLPDSSAPGARRIVTTPIQPGLGADSAVADFGPSQSCSSGYVTLALAYRPNAQTLRLFTLDEDGWSGSLSAETTLSTEASPDTLAEPEVAYFEASGAASWFVAWTTQLVGSGQSDLSYWVSTQPGVRYAWLAYADGSASIARPRASVSGSEILLAALREVADGRQLMTRRISVTGEKLPASSSVETVVTSGGCAPGASACRPGTKGTVAAWWRAGKLLYSASGGASVGTVASTLTCQ